MMAGAMIGGPWDEMRIAALANTFGRLLGGSMPIDMVTQEIRTSVEFLQPMWDVLDTHRTVAQGPAREHLVQTYVGEYSFPNTRALYAALKGIDIDIAAFKEVSPDGLSVSAQLFVEAGYWGEGYSLMKKRCSTRVAKSHGLDEYFTAVEEAGDGGELDEWGF